MLTLRQTALLPVLALLLALQATTAAGENPAAVDNCTELPTSAGFNGALDSENIRLLTWNIQKSSQAGWRADLRRFADQTDLLLLQEATLENDLQDALEAQYHSVFAPGYRTGSSQSGVMTLSRVPAMSHCFLSHQEPWLRTPKATSISRYSLNGQQESLLVINLHGVNFALGSTSLEQQMRDASILLNQHQGPVIFSGDFNTWSEKRMAMVSELMSAMDLRPLSFPQDHRVQIFGQTLDHIFVRGLRTVNTGSDSVESSDHNPIYATLAVES